MGLFWEHLPAIDPEELAGRLGTTCAMQASHIVEKVNYSYILAKICIIVLRKLTHIDSFYLRSTSHLPKLLECTTWLQYSCQHIQYSTIYLTDLECQNINAIISLSSKWIKNIISVLLPFIAKKIVNLMPLYLFHHDGEKQAHPLSPFKYLLNTIFDMVLSLYISTFYRFAHIFCIMAEWMLRQTLSNSLCQDLVRRGSNATWAMEICLVLICSPSMVSYHNHQTLLMSSL